MAPQLPAGWMPVHRSALREEFTDLVIECGEQKHRVHKIVVCPQSTFMRAACTVQLKEAQEGIIKLPEDDPKAVSTMIYFMYTGDYKCCLGNGQTVRDMDAMVKQLQLQTTVDSSMAHLQKILPRPEEGISDGGFFGLGYTHRSPIGGAQYSYTSGAYVKADQRHLEHPDEHLIRLIHDMPFHAEVYALGEKYGVTGLRERALSKMMATLPEPSIAMETQTFRDAYRILYTKVPLSNCLLFRWLKHNVRNHKTLTSTKEFQELMEELRDVLN